MNKQILLIDDEPDLRQTLAEFLEDEGYTVTQAENGKLGLELLSAGATPQLILLDYMMPVMDGKTFCTEIQKDEKLNGKFPIVLLTAARIEQTLVENMKLSEQLSKPINIPVFLDVVKKYCKR